MRVLQIHWAFQPTTGGVESHLADLSAGLAARGCEVTVLTGEPAPDPLPGVTVLRTDMLELNRLRNGATKDAAYREALLHEVDRVVEQVAPEVVHGHNLHHFDADPALVLDELADRRGFQLHHTFHETWPDLLRDTPVYRRWAANYAVSGFVRDRCAALIGFTPELRRLGIDTDRFTTRRRTLSADLAAPRDTAEPAGSRGRAERVPVILHPARLLPWKGVHVSVRMLSLLAQRGVRARLVLTDTARIADWNSELAAYRRAIVQLIGDLGLSDQVELRSVSYRSMPALYEECDVVVYPTIADEPYGLVPLEAMSCARPVVASRTGGIPETVVQGITGYLVPAEDPEALAKGVERVLEDPGSAQAMGEAGRRWVRDRFELQHYVDAMVESYRVASMAK